jgi:archaellum component FlaC
MKNKVTFTYSDISRVVRKILKEEENEQIEISPEEYMDLLKRVNYQAQAIPRLPKFKGKTIVVTGSINLNDNQKITDLGPIIIQGNLNASRSGLSTLDQTKVYGSEWVWDTPVEAKRLARILRQNLASQDELRKAGEWDLTNPNIPEEGEKAQALFRYIENLGSIDTISEDDEEEINELKSRIKSLEEEQENLSTENEDFEERYDEVTDQITELEEEIESILDDKIDVYDLSEDGGYYQLTRFKSLSSGQEFAVGDYSDADRSLNDYYEEHIDDPINYFSTDHLKNYIDEKKVIEDFEDSIRDWVTEEPDSYGVQLELSDSQEEEIWLLEMEKWVYENEGVRAPVQNATRETGDVFDFEDPEDNRFQYRNTSSDPSRNNWVLYKDGQVVSPHQIYDDEDTEEHEEAREERISDIDYEIEEIKENPDGEPTDDAIEEAVEDYISDHIGGRALSFLSDMGYDWTDYIDKDELLEDTLSNSDYGDLNGYDGNYDVYTINGTSYVVMRID